MSAPAIFDRGLLQQRRRRSARLGSADFLLQQVAADMADRLAVVKRSFSDAADLGTPTDAIRRALQARSNVRDIVAADVAGERETLSLSAGSPSADQQARPVAPGRFDLIVSGLALHFVNDLPGVLAQIRQALKPDGLFIAAMLGGDTLTELRQSFAEAESIVEGGVSPRVAPFADVRALGGLLQRAGFALPVTDSDKLIVRYDTPLGLMHDLRRMAATNILRERRRIPLRRETLAQTLQIYADNFSDPDHRVRATFEIIWLSGWAPHASQQQPLKPGSAQVSLADALGVTADGRKSRDG